MFCWRNLGRAVTGLVLLGIVLAPSRATADPVTFVFRGEVSSVFDGLASLPEATKTARTFAGYYIFDSETPNTGEPYAEGFEGIYHHDRPPYGVVVRVGGSVFRSSLVRPDFDVIVHDQFGFVGSDDYGFRSRNNVARGLLRPQPDRLDVDWFASTFQNDPIHGVELPLVPPDLRLLGGGTFTVYGECTPCAAPAAFYRIEGTLTSLRRIRHRADMNADGVVNRADLADLLKGWGHENMIMTDGDLNDDARISLADLAVLQGAFDLPGGVASPEVVPEPSSAALAVLALGALGWQTRRRLRARPT